MPAIPGVINNGVISKWLASKPSVTQMLTVDSDGNVGRQAIPSAPALAWGNITGTLSAQTDLQNALDGKAPFVHGHAIGDIANLSSTLTAIDIALAALDAAKLNTSAFTFANLGSKPTTLSGYGITDAQPVDADLTAIAALTTQPYGRSLLTQADAGAARTTLGLGSLATQNGTISDYLLSATAASSYLPLTGGTLTGGLSGTSLTLSGIATINGGNQNAAGIQLGGSTVFGPYGLSNGWTFVQASAAQMRFSGGGIVIQSGKTFAWGNSFTDTGTTQLWEDASHVVAQRNGANAQTWRLYGNYVDASNYRRLYITSTTGGAFTLGVEGLGSGVNGNQLRILQPITTGTSGAVGAIGGISYALSVQNNAATSWIEILNSGGINKGAFFGLDGNNFQQWNYQGGDIQFFTSGVASAGTERLRITNQGNVGIGSQTPTAALVIRRSGSSSPEIRFEDGDVTTPFTNSGFSPALDPSTIGVWGFSASASGGISFSGFTNNTAAAYPLVFVGYQGHASPVNPSVQFAGFKTNGTNGSTTLASTELIAGFYNGTVAGTPVVTIAASGAIATSGNITASGTATINSGIISLGDIIYRTSTQNLVRLTNNSGEGMIRLGTNGGGLTVDIWSSVTSNRCHFAAFSDVEFRCNNGISVRNNSNSDYQDITARNIILTGSARAISLDLRNSTTTTRADIHHAYTDANNYIRQALSFTTYSGTVYAQWVAEGLGTGAVNIPMVVSPRGTGAFILGPMPDGTATGGNARGANAVDLQVVRNAANKVASGIAAFIGGGSRNTVSSNYGAAFGVGCVVSNGNEGNLAGGYESTASGSQSSFAWGNRCTASGSESSWVIGYESSSTANAAISMGRNARSDRAYQYSHAAGPFSTAGDAQYTRFVLKNRTTDATPTVLVGGVLPSFVTRLSINTGEILGFVANITGSKSDGTAIAHYVRKGAIKRISNTTTLAYVEAVGTDYEDNAATDVAITADDANDALQISVTGIAGETWRWVATVEAVDLGFGT